jgi:poly-gamma-glutamate capsule biosynthesis protein CapA/YwtB (metallophosphatase superfamily)
MNELLLGFVGDLMVDRESPDEPFRRVVDLLDAPDIMFGNSEAAYTDDPHPAPSAATPIFPRSDNLDVFAKAGFDVLSLANNHILDAGHRAMLENRQRLNEQGVATCGAGATLEEARRPAVVVRQGIRVAYLAYASVFPIGYEARSNVPGLAPLRARDFWRAAVENYHAPGTAPRCSTIPDEQDLAHTATDIREANDRADLVIASFHWGDFLRPYHLTDHETRTARWAVEQGAHLVVGHHHHALRGIEWHRGRPIFYGLGHFVFDLDLQLSAEAEEMFATIRETAGDYAIFPRPGWPLLPMHPDTRMTIWAWARAGRSGIADIGFVPCRLHPDGSVEAVDPESGAGREVLDYVTACNDTQRLNGRLTTEGAPSVAGHRSVRVVPRAQEQ